LVSLLSSASASASAASPSPSTPSASSSSSSSASSALRLRPKATKQTVEGYIHQSFRRMTCCAASSATSSASTATRALLLGSRSRRVGPQVLVHRSQISSAWSRRSSTTLAPDQTIINFAKRQTKTDLTGLVAGAALGPLASPAAPALPSLHIQSSLQFQNCI